MKEACCILLIHLMKNAGRDIRYDRALEAYVCCNCIDLDNIVTEKETAGLNNQYEEADRLSA